MAYDVNIDYSAANAELKKQLAAATDAATKAALQAQLDANNVSRTEKIASDLTKYGKYASDSELDSAAGLMAQNQIGTGYETQKANLNTSYDQAIQNANNNALSRGMARSTFVQDRMANLDSQRANALTQIDAAKALAIQNAQANILSNYRTNTANELANQKTEFANTIGAYSQDYQQEINNVQNNNDTTDDWKIPYLQQARNEKIAALQAAALKAAKTINDNVYTPKTPDPDPDPDPQVEFNAAPAIDETSPFGIITDVVNLKKQGYSSAQIKANAKAAYEAKAITGEQYQMYVQYAGRD